MKTQSLGHTINRFLLYWSFPLIWATVIFLFSSHPTQRASEIYWKDFFLKKSVHMFEYAVLTILLYRGFKNSGYSVERSILYAFAISVIYGASDEFHQSFTPGREPTIRDVVFDTIGATIASLTLWKLLPTAPLKLKNWAEKLDLL